MILYVCDCGSQFQVPDNSEASRKQKRTWKEEHKAGHENPGHHYLRRVIHKKSK